MIKKLLVLLSFLYVGSVLAATVEYKDENVTIQLYDGPCVSEKMVALAHTEQDKETIKSYQAAKVVYKGKVLEACWVFDVNHIDIVDEEGTAATDVSPEIFKVVQPL